MKAFLDTLLQKLFEKENLNTVIYDEESQNSDSSVSPSNAPVSSNTEEIDV